MPRVGADWHRGGLERKGRLSRPRARDAASMLEGREVGEEIWL